ADVSRRKRSARRANTVRSTPGDDTVWPSSLNCHGWRKESAVLRRIRYLGGRGSANQIFAEYRSLRKAAGLDHVRFHDGRHTALTRLAEKGVADWVIRAQFGHVSSAMMAVYSHVRRKALDEAAKALEPEHASHGAPTEAADTSIRDGALPGTTAADAGESRVT